MESEGMWYEKFGISDADFAVILQTRTAAALEWDNDFWDESELRALDRLMELRLVYNGPLKPSANNNRQRENKHEIRKAIHRQLSVLWKVHPVLKLATERVIGRDPYVYHKLPEALAKRHTKCGFRFVPLVTDLIGTVASLDILLLRRDEPGNLIAQGGDIDARVKTLLDALSVPVNCDQLPEGTTPGTDEDPFYCLLEDDKLVTEIRVLTDRLLVEPTGTKRADAFEASLVIHVTIKARTEFNIGNLRFSE